MRTYYTLIAAGFAWLGMGLSPSVAQVHGQTYYYTERGYYPALATGFRPAPVYYYYQPCTPTYYYYGQPRVSYYYAPPMYQQPYTYQSAYPPAYPAAKVATTVT